MVSFTQHGDFKKLSRYFERLKETVKIGILDKYGKAGVEALASATPKDSGKTAESWTYEIERQNGVVSLNFLNSNINEGVPIAIILQYGHDYIHPAVRPIFDKLASDAWKEITSL